MDPASQPAKDVQDNSVKQVENLANNTDTRPVNLFNVAKMELPAFCKDSLSQKELLKLSVSVNKFTDCWL